MKRKNFIYLCILVLMPAIYIVSSMIIRDQRGPYWLAYRVDPQYAYLLNSLSVANLKTPVHIDHPGTPLQILGGIVLKTSYVMESLINPSVASFNEEILKHPEFYLKLINLTLLLLNAGSIFLLGLVSFFLSRSLTLGLILQTTPFLVPHNLSVSTEVSPEPLLLFICQLLVLLLVIYLHGENMEKSKWFPVTLGITVGMGIATKVTFIPMMLIFLILPQIYHKILALIGSIVSFVLITLPIISEYGRMKEWLFSVVTHKGIYGRGETGIIEITSVWKNLNELISQSPIFFAVLGISSIVYALFFFLRQYGNYNLLENESDVQLSKLNTVKILIILIMLSQILITLKHPASRYLVPSMGLCGLLIFIQLLSLQRLMSLNRKMNITPSASYIIVLVLCLLICTGNLFNVSSHSFYKSEHYKDLIGIQKMINEKYSNCTKINFWRSSSVEFALMYGNDWAGEEFTTSLRRLYPQTFFYRTWVRSRIIKRKGNNFDFQQLNLRDLVENGPECVILQAYNSQFKQVDPDKLGVEIEPVFEGAEESLYRLKSPKLIKFGDEVYNGPQKLDRMLRLKYYLKLVAFCLDKREYLRVIIMNKHDIWLGRLVRIIAV